MNESELPLFPLSAHLLQGGRMSLRIFEPRYIRMVKHACASGRGFVMCMLNATGDKNKNEHIYSIGTYAEVIDFDLLEDGLLGIKVAGIHSVEVSNIRTEFDGLRIGDCSPIQPWNCDITPQQIAPMDERLKEIFEQYHELGAMYDAPDFDNPVWVMQRWLELLPVDARQKQHFLQQQDCKKLMNYLSALIE
ncbi:LON peptidase substrate-binding domain-containing protein [Alteromonas halophila]|uniref:ATP-dependent protease n=1 Tax=Alteromonas halophila TaxID=516698 RepID=A0A918MYE2_9ALTE|nr:LON peptidase substrate-binding domain-containing protein [Alteromonas halophila]GGW85689.1 ATP-dependent protease [Alteromonas halophila]